MPWTIVHAVTCAQCGERTAAIFIRRSVSGSGPLGGEGPAQGGGSDLALCEICARSRGITAAKGRLDIGIEELMRAAAVPASESGMPAACPSCGSSLAQLRRLGRLGCPSCIEAFYPAIRRAFGPLPREASPRTAPSSAVAVERPPLAPSAPPPEAGPTSFPFLASGGGHDSDVVLSSSVSLSRSIEGLPFPGGPGGGAAPSRSLVSHALEGLPRLRRWTMRQLDPATRRCLSERGLVPRSYAADPEALLAASIDFPLYVLADEGEHLRLRARFPGLALEAGIGAVQELHDRLAARGLRFLWDPRIGWVCASIEDCGIGMSLALSLHLPALAMTGLHERFLRSILREGVAVRGSYSEGESSAGAVYEAVIGPSSRLGLDGMVDGMRAIAEQASQAERRARAELASKARGELLDALGRAYGLALHAHRLGPGEGAALASTLRLGAILGLLRKEADNETEAVGSSLVDRLGRCMECMGPASIAAESGLAEQRSGAEDEELRSEFLRSALKGAMLLVGGH
ncbi:MAG TPA: hypothetical protein VFL04_07720 [Rectinemataceae bacterium]|nr:hypothetical protein [Rectinemataceae bacterium]